jgi:hypothetical protein
MSFSVSLNIGIEDSPEFAMVFHCSIPLGLFLWGFVAFEVWNIERSANDIFYRHQEAGGEERCGDGDGGD